MNGLLNTVMEMELPFSGFLMLRHMSWLLNLNDGSLQVQHVVLGSSSPQMVKMKVILNKTMIHYIYGISLVYFHRFTSVHDKI
jgi:hypothetical protein